MSDTEQEWKPKARPQSFVQPIPPYSAPNAGVGGGYHNSSLVLTLGQDDGTGIFAGAGQCLLSLFPNQPSWERSASAGYLLPPSTGTTKGRRGADKSRRRKQMVMIQNRELEALQARIREAEERLKSRQSRVLTQSDINKATGNSQRVEGEEQPHTSQSPLSSPISGPSDEGSTGSATSAATSHDMDDPGDADYAIDEDDKQKNKANAS
ncbi:hypothetical protein PAAG_06212 [Paecilomyces variotii No. 5]|uniref:BZIP domain-containing protein n=1 Tax=Byssochlamys spectabilis (strain No. 5 / NBRC 109023) TaxID=1356009 RepID=V5HXF3_BYSSN|nr:hypothetical protein PAAG_06212 [Paecilomyces variotii No. 5]